MKTMLWTPYSEYTSYAVLWTPDPEEISDMIKAAAAANARIDTTHEYYDLDRVTFCGTVLTDSVDPESRRIQEIIEDLPRDVAHELSKNEVVPIDADTAEELRKEAVRAQPTLQLSVSPVYQQNDVEWGLFLQMFTGEYDAHTSFYSAFVPRDVLQQVRDVEPFPPIVR